MYIIQREANEGGGRPALQSWTSPRVPAGYLLYPDELFDVFYPADKRCAGFVTITGIDENTQTVTAVEWNDEAYDAFASSLPPEPDPVEEAQNTKGSELSKACEEAINAGSDVALSDGSVKHFSYSLADQANVSEMFNALAAGATEYPYHADGEECMMYGAEDITRIYATLSMHKTGHITYQNQLKCYVKEQNDIETINAVQYGDELTGKYLDTYNQLMAQAQEQMAKILANIAKQ